MVIISETPEIFIGDTGGIKETGGSAGKLSTSTHTPFYLDYRLVGGELGD